LPTGPINSIFLSLAAENCTKEMVPRVSILMPTLDAMNYVDESISAVLDQSLSNFELLVLDGGSTDGTLDYIDSISDCRVCLYKNTGDITKSLNKGIAEAQGEYIARADADAVPYKQWLERCIHFLKDDQEYAAVGTQAKRVSVDGNQQITNMPESHEDISEELIWKNPMIHPTLVIRKAALISVDGYRERQWEDYDLMIRIANEHKLANLSDVLVKDYAHPNSVVNSTPVIRSRLAALRCGLLAIYLSNRSLHSKVLLGVIRSMLSFGRIVYQVVLS
jgi:glycosyltransferase involved in cell wall biosynthesis